MNNTPVISVNCNNNASAARSIPRMLTIKQTAALFNLPEHYVRNLAKSGKIIATKAGAKFLINADRLAEFLNTSMIMDEERAE